MYGGLASGVKKSPVEINGGWCEFEGGQGGGEPPKLNNRPEGTP